LVTHFDVTSASGAVTVSRLVVVLPISHAFHPGRRALTTIVTFVPGAIRFAGVSLPPASVRAIGRPSASVA